MGIEFDPKIKPVGASESVKRGGQTDPARQGATKKPTVRPEAMEKPQMMATPEKSAATRAALRGKSSPSDVQKNLAKLREGLLRGGRDAATLALAAAAAYRMRRSKGARKQAIDLCADVVEHCEELADEARDLSSILTAEGELHKATPESTFAACRHLVGLLDSDAPPRGDLDGLARATLSRGFIQLATQFPDQLEALELSYEIVLEHAMRLAEEAIQIAPHLPDGRVALARLVLCQGDAEAARDALEILEEALALDPTHDPAETARAAALWALGRLSEAREAIEGVIRRGNPLPQPLLLRALLARDEGRPEDALKDLARVLKLAPDAGQVWVDVAHIAASLGDEQTAQESLAQARALLGDLVEEP